MTSLAWKINRLRAMSAPEVAHRGYRFGAQQLEKLSSQWGREPHPESPVECGIALFEDVLEWRDQWHRHFTTNEPKLDELIRGQVELFGYGVIDFGAVPDWHRDPLSGVSAPMTFGKTLDYRDEALVGNVKVLWELGRHQHLIPLAVAYACSGEVRYRDAVTTQIDDWVVKNPYGRGIHWCSALEAGLRLIAWAIIDGLLRLANPAAGLLAASTDGPRLGRAIYQQAWFVRHFLSRYSSANNHLIGELSGLFVATGVFDCGASGRRWNEFARRELELQARVQVHADGVGKEQSVYYHLWVLEYFLLVFLLAKRMGTPMSPHFSRQIQAMHEFLDDVSIAGAGPPQIGDADDGCVARFEPAWPRRPYADVSAAVKTVFASEPQPATSQKAFFYRLIATASSPADVAAAPPAAFPRAYMDGGYAILGDQCVRLVFDAGELGYPAIAAHGHADALSFCLAIDDGWWFVDPGTFSYHGDRAWRDYFRGSAAHNTIVIDDQNQSTIGGPFLWLNRAHATLEGVGTEGATQIAAGCHDGYRELGLLHTREIRYDPLAATIVINDRLHGAHARDRIRAKILYHLAPALDVSMGGHSATVTRPDNDRELHIELPPACAWQLLRGEHDPIQGWYSSQMGSKVPAPVLSGDYEGPAPCNFITRISLGELDV